LHYNILVTEPEGSTLLIPKPATGHDSEPVTPSLQSISLCMNWGHSNEESREVFWIMMQCSVVTGYQHFWGPCCLHLWGRWQ